MENFGIILQARMGSTRLPGKILRPFYEDLTILDILLNNLHKLSNVKVIVATSINKENDELEDYLKQRGELVFRGSEDDVLERFIEAAEFFDIEKIIRICSDNPFIDINGIQQLIEEGRATECDYAGIRVNNTPSILTHFGFWGEYVTLDALKKVYAHTEKGTPAHEHVTNYIYTHPLDYICSWVKCPDFIESRSDIRLTVDTESDFSNAQRVYAALVKYDEPIPLKKIVDFVDGDINLKDSMRININNNTK